MDFIDDPIISDSHSMEWIVTFHLCFCRDRFDYGAAISESWKRQTLLNLIKIRYPDAPAFMDATSVISQYAFKEKMKKITF